MNLELIPLPTVFICLLENNSILEISIHHFFGNWNIFLDDSTSWIHLAIVHTMEYDYFEFVVSAYLPQQIYKKCVHHLIAYQDTCGVDDGIQLIKSLYIEVTTGVHFMIYITHRT